MKLTRRTLAVLTGALLGGLAASASAQTKWDLPSAYPASNFHTENLAQFAKDVQAATGGKLTIQVHDNASLFKAPEIKRAVQGGQAQAGEFLMVNFQNEWPLWGLDGLPFLATSYAESFKLYQASKAAVQKKLGEQGMMLLYAVAWPPQGIFSKKQVNAAAVSALGLPTDFLPAVPVGLMKILSGSGARGLMVDVMQTHGVDSFPAKLAAIIQGSTETTFYVLAVYFGSVGVKHTRHALPCALFADAVGLVAAVAVAYAFFR